MSEHKDESKKSKILVVFYVVMILGGAAMWNAWDYFGTEGLSPKVIKEMANVYEQKCYALANDIKLCKRHMALRHMDCLKKEGVSRETPKSAPEYHQDRYEACMLVHRDEDLKNLKRR